MTDVVIAGIGQVPVGEYWDTSLRTLASRAVRAAVKDAGDLRPQAMYVGNYLAPMVSHQSNLGALLADEAGLNGIEAYTAEAAGASGAAHSLAMASGFMRTVPRGLLCGLGGSTKVSCIWPRVTRSPSLRDPVSTLRPLTRTPLLLPRSWIS